MSGFSADGCDLLALPTEPSPLRMERGIWAAWQRKLVRAVHFSCVCSHLDLSPCLKLLCDERDAEQAASVFASRLGADRAQIEGQHSGKGWLGLRRETWASYVNLAFLTLHLYSCKRNAYSEAAVLNQSWARKGGGLFWRSAEEGQVPKANSAPESFNKICSHSLF